MHRTLRPVVALATALALVALTAAPSAATTGTATAGTATFNFTPTLNRAIAPGSTQECSSAAHTVIDVTMSSATAGTATLDMLPTRNFVALLPFSGTGAVTISGGTITIGPLALSANGYPETAPDSCTPDLTMPKCSTNITGSLTLSGTWTGTVTPPALSGTVVLSGTSPLSAAGCVPPFSGYNGKTMTISNLTVPF